MSTGLGCGITSGLGFDSGSATLNEKPTLTSSSSTEHLCIKSCRGEKNTTGSGRRFVDPTWPVSRFGFMVWGSGFLISWTKFLKERLVSSIILNGSHLFKLIEFLLLTVGLETSKSPDVFELISGSDSGFLKLSDLDRFSMVLRS
ncbi:hypothetical protein Hanom_Chr00s000001g01597731 [Helianthus anomalus]